ncbi:MAG: beta-ketoacyl synthase N-terminal-like domain-containing protein [Nitrospirota bacterium]
MKCEQRRVVLTGLGPVTAIGVGKDTLWNSVMEGRTGLEKVPLRIEDEKWVDFWAHRIDHFDIADFNIEQFVLDDIASWKKGKEDRDLLYLLAAVKLALDDSGLKYDREDNDVALFLTVEQPGFERFCSELIGEALAYTREHFESDRHFAKVEIFKHLFDKMGASGYDLQTFMYLFLVAKAFGIHGYSLFTNNACASGLFAIESAARQIKYGGSDTAIVAGGDYPCTLFKYLWFRERNLYAEDGRIKPFSRVANGIVLGDGASALVLEELNHARNRNAHIYAEFVGAGLSLEGWKVVLPNIGGNSYQKAIKEVLTSTSINPEAIDLINPHGVGIKITDKYEAMAINEVFGKGRNHVTAFKPYVGHNLGGSALMETIILLMSMHHNIIPPTLNAGNYDADYNLNLITRAKRVTLDTVMKLSCGFAGYNAAAIFRKL